MNLKQKIKDMHAIIDKIIHLYVYKSLIHLILR